MDSEHDETEDTELPEPRNLLGAGIFADSEGVKEKMDASQSFRFQLFFRLSFIYICVRLRLTL